MNAPQIPKPETLATLRVLDEIQENPSITQREISRRVGISLGMTNLLLQKMARRAWIKITTIPGRRVLYALTPKGFGEKVRKTKDFVRLSLRYYQEMQKTLAEKIREAGIPHPHVAAFQPGELEPVLSEAAHAAGGSYVGPLENGAVSRVNVVVAFEPPEAGLRRHWEGRGITVIDIS